MMPAMAAELEVCAEPRNTAGMPFTLNASGETSSSDLAYALSADQADLRAITWSSMREMRGEITKTNFPAKTAGY